ncbi:N-terminal amidase [Colletotrichum asianum]
MRIACLQFAPQVGDVDNNLNRADSVLSKANPEDLDLLVLPELAFSGYNFKSLQHISPFLEPSGSGITSLWARTTALKYNCNVVAGYPEKADVSGSWPTGPEYYNSAIVVNEEGETIANYRKSFLYYTDESWALEGDGFFEGFIPGLGHTSIGICNPYKFRAPWHAFEFGFHILHHESNFVIVSMAWMTREDSRTFSRMPNEPDMDTLTYWVTRLEPLIRAEKDTEIIVVFCNRTGMEDDAVYAGTSAVVGVQDGEVKIYGVLGRGEKELLVVDTKNPPYAKLVYRPEPEKPLGVRSELQKTPSSPASPGGPAPSSSSSQGSASQKGSSSHAPSQPRSPPDGSSTTSDTPRKSPQGRQNAKQAKLPPKIQIPISYAPPPVLSGRAPADSPGSESVNFPTPTAPSPTPLSARPKLGFPQSPLNESWEANSPVPQSAQSARSIQSVQSIQSIRSNQSVRSNVPKLIIPQSPPLAPWQFGSPVPLSGRSFHSVHSVRSVESVRSNESYQSYQSGRTNSTVTSNPRPPEDSTPYPQSGLPLSGYPTRFSNRRVFDDFPSLNQAPFTPITPFEDASPSEPRYFWRPSETLLKSPMSPEVRTAVAKPDMRTAAAESDQDRTQNFDNFALFSHKEIPSRSHSSSSIRTAATAGTAKKSDDQAHTNSHARALSHGGKSRNISRSRTTEAPRPSRNTSQGRFVDNTSDTEASTNPSSQDGIPVRPSSPKSRNASRSRSHQRSKSFSHREHATEISKSLETISRRAESVNRMQDLHGEVAGTPPNVSSSSKPRSCSRGRSSEQHSSIIIAASRSILDSDVTQKSTANPQEESREQQHKRTKSVSSTGFHARSGSAASNRRGIAPRSRTPSTGERSRPRPPSRAASRGRKPGLPFSPPRMVPRDPSQPVEDHRVAWDAFMKAGQKSSKSKDVKVSLSSERVEKNDRTEAIVSLSGPYGKVSTSSSPSRPRESPDLPTGRSISTLAVTAGSKTRDGVVGDRPGDGSLSSLNSNVAALPSSTRSPSTPRFEPSTPKAMVLIRDDEDSLTGGPPLLDLANNFSNLACIDRPVGSHSDGSKAIVA